MQIQLMSDLHFEFHRDAGQAFMEEQDPTDIDVLVIAGDIAVGKGIGSAMDLICSRYRDAHVVYVLGNHEYYDTDRASVLKVVQDAQQRNPNLRFLDNTFEVIGGVRFFGSTLWYPPLPDGLPFGKAMAMRNGMTDFRVIRDLEEWVYDYNAYAVQAMKGLQEGDVVVTHHLPAEQSVAWQWKGDILNHFFLCDVEEIIRATQPQVWMHGHTHSSCAYWIEETAVLCNPFGYARREENAEFTRVTYTTEDN